MSKLVQVDVVETRHKAKMVLELTGEEVAELLALLQDNKKCLHGWGYVPVTLAPRMESLLHVLRSGPSETRTEEIKRGMPGFA